MNYLFIRSSVLEITRGSVWRNTEEKESYMIGKKQVGE